MSSSALYDVRGPRAIRRHRIAGALAALALLGLLALVAAKLAERGQFDGSVWHFLTVHGTWVAIWDGLTNTLSVAAVAIALALSLGTLLATARMSKRRWLRWPATTFVEFFRAVPLLLMILVIFLAAGQELGRFWSLVIALTLYSGSVLAEILRGGIRAVPRGQVEAAQAIGLPHWQVLRLVILPQAVRIMLPAIIGQTVIVLKDTALGLIIAQEDLVWSGRQLYIFYDNPLAVGIVIAAIYIVINAGLSRFAVALETRQRRQRATASSRFRQLF